MKEFFSEIWGGLSAPADNTFSGWFMLIAMWFLCLVFVGMPLAWAVYFIDESFLRLRAGSGSIVGKTFITAHVTTEGYYDSSKRHHKNTVYHPDAWRVDIKIDGKTVSIFYGKEYFDGLRVGMQVHVNYYVSRIFRTIYIQ